MSKKFLAVLLVVVMSIGTFVLPTYAKDSVTTVCTEKSVNLNGSKKYGSYKCTTYMTGKLGWVGALKAKFKGTTGGSYTGCKKADKIVHVDNVSASGIGSISVGYKAANCSISGSTASYTYETSNEKKIVNNVSYIASKGVTFSVTVTCSTTYTFGSTNYRVVPGDC